MKTPIHLQNPHDIPLTDYLLFRQKGIMNKLRCLVYGSFSANKRRAVVLAALYSLCHQGNSFPDEASRQRLVKEMNLTVGCNSLVYPMVIYYRIWEGLNLKELHRYDLPSLAARLSKRVPFCFRYGNRKLMCDDILRVLRLAA